MSKIIGVHTPADIKNLAINGNFDFFQRSTSASLSAATSGYYADMFKCETLGSTAKSVTVSRSTNVPTVAQSNFASSYSLSYVSNTAVSTLAAGDAFTPARYILEGLDFAKIHQKTVTFGFWFSTTIAGTYSFALRNASTARSYVTTFSASTGWQFVPITLQLDLSGTWNLDNTVGVYVDIGTIAGTTYQTSTLNAWQAGNFSTASTATNFAATSGATINVAQFSIVEGPLGFGAKGFERAGESIAAELELCQRYCIAFSAQPMTAGTYTSALGSGVIEFPVTMRAAPTVVSPSFSDRNNFGSASYNSGQTATSVNAYFPNFNTTTPAYTYGSVLMTAIMDAGL